MFAKVPLDFELLVKKAAEENGIFIQNLKSGDVLRVETEGGYFYEFTVVLPEKKLVLVTSNNPFIPQRLVCMHIYGSLLTSIGSSIRDGWISLGHRIELNGWVLMPTTKVTINGQDIFLPKDKVQ